MLWDLGYWHAFVPELARLKGVVQNRYHSLDVWDHTMAVFRSTPQDLYLRLAGLFHDLGKWETASREYYLAGRLEYREQNYWIEDYQVIGTRGKRELEFKLGPGWQTGQTVGGQDDNYPHLIQFKRLLRKWKCPGFNAVEDGKRLFNHEGRPNSAEILKYAFAMFFRVKGKNRSRICWI